MRVHHLNCGSMEPLTSHLVTHVLVLETRSGLVLVDSGYGTQDFLDPGRRIGFFRHLAKPVMRPEECAVNQLREIGLDPADVRHIVLTHMDFDHAGGIADFPDAQIHVTSAEALAALTPPTLKERIRYNSAQFSHGPKVVEHAPFGEKWKGFAAATPLTEIDEGIVLVSLPGHSRGHACVAVDDGERWVLHVGDAVDTRAELEGRPQDAPLPVRLQAYINAYDLDQYLANQQRLTELWRRGDEDLIIVCAHDPGLFADAKALPGHS